MNHSQARAYARRLDEKFGKGHRPIKVGADRYIVIRNVSRREQMVAVARSRARIHA